MDVLRWVGFVEVQVQVEIVSAGPSIGPDTVHDY